MSTLLFDSNVAVFGGGIAMDDRCLVSGCCLLTCFNIVQTCMHVSVRNNSMAHCGMFHISSYCLLKLARKILALLACTSLNGFSV